MPVKIQRTTAKKFFYEEIDEQLGFLVEGEEPTMMAFRPATPRDENVRTDIIGGGKIVYESDGGEAMTGRMEIRLSEIPMATVYAVFEESNILDENGKPALRKGMPYSEFKRIVGSLPKEYLDAFYESALEMNPQWKEGNENF